MDIKMQQEQFSRAYVLAIAAKAGCNHAQDAVDEDSIDLTLKKKNIEGCASSRAELDVQLKCTMQDVLKKDGNIHFPLSIKNYDDLRAQDIHVPRILVVVLVPREINDWINQTEEELALRRCGYWYSLYGIDETTNTDSVTLQIPHTNIFSAEFLERAMAKIANGESLCTLV